MAGLWSSRLHLQRPHFGRGSTHHALGARLQGGRLLRVVLGGEYRSRGRVAELALTRPPAERAARKGLKGERTMGCEGLRFWGPRPNLSP